MALIKGCIDQEYKKIILEGIDAACLVRSVDEEFCSTFKSQLNRMRDCKDVKPRKLSAYQVHMSKCLKEHKNFDTCLTMWRSGQRMDKPVIGMEK